MWTIQLQPRSLSVMACDLRGPHCTHAKCWLFTFLKFHVVSISLCQLGSQAQGRHLHSNQVDLGVVVCGCPGTCEALAPSSDCLKHYSSVPKREISFKFSFAARMAYFGPVLTTWGLGLWVSSCESGMSWRESCMLKRILIGYFGVICGRSRPRLPSLAELVQGLGVSANTDGS